MAKLKILIQQVFMISTGILLIEGINGAALHFMGKDYSFEWYEPFSIILLSILCAIPTLFFILNESGKQRNSILNIVLHCLSIWIITMIIGGIFEWYNTIYRFLAISIECISLYVLVWLTSLWFVRIEDRKINQALKDIQDEE